MALGPPFGRYPRVVAVACDRKLGGNAAFRRRLALTQVLPTSSDEQAAKTRGQRRRNKTRLQGSKVTSSEQPDSHGFATIK